jgi:DNA recombination protein RmuC
MLIAILVLQSIALLALIVLFLRKPPIAQPDPRIADVGDKFNRLDLYLREALAQMRTDAPQEATRTRKENAESAAELRKEVLASITTLGSTLRDGLNNFRDDNKTSGDQLRHAIEAQMDTLAQRLSSFTTESGAQQIALRESLNTKLTELTNSNTALQERLRSSVEERLAKLNETNIAKLEEMRATVDEKLHATLQTRLTESFGQVTDQLTKVHAGLGEMTKLSADVDDLSRIFTKVRSRGQIGEAMLETLLKQMLAEGQFVRNEQVKPETQEAVEFAVRFPGPNGSVLLPIDSKFPRESWERLESAYDAGGASEIRAARNKFENVIRTEAKRISSKYINEPVTTPTAIMFLPTEGLYAEVMRCDGLHDDIQQNYHVMIAGPSNLSAILTSFQMVFSLVNLQKKGGEVWKVLASARSEFGKFGILMDKMDKQVGTVQSTIRDLGTRTRAINRTLQDVSADPAQAILPLVSNNGFDGVLPALAAGEEQE